MCVCVCVGVEYLLCVLCHVLQMLSHLILTRFLCRCITPILQKRKLKLSVVKCLPWRIRTVLEPHFEPKELDFRAHALTQVTLWENSYGGHELIPQSTNKDMARNWRSDLSGSPSNTQSSANGLPWLSLHAPLPQSDTNTLMPAPAESILSLKIDELRVRTDASLTKPTKLALSQTHVFLIPEKCMLRLRLGGKVWSDFHFSATKNYPWSFSNSKEFWGLNSALPVFLQILNYVHVLNTGILLKKKKRKKKKTKKATSSTEKSLQSLLGREKEGKIINSTKSDRLITANS